MPDSNPPRSFSAADSALGYLYQVRVALLWALRRLPTDPDFSVTVETLDDVTFEKSGEPTDLLQTKHHRTQAANLTDASPDLWKTLRIWFEGRAAGTVPPSAALHLITTSVASAGSAVAKLRSADRDVEKALAELDATASTSTNKDNAKAYEAFLAATFDERREMLESITIIDSAPAITDIDAELHAVIFWAVQREHQHGFLKRLEGWWYRRVIKQLAEGAPRAAVLSNELEEEMSELREQFKQDSLPIDPDLLQFSVEDAAAIALSDSLFIRQLELAKAGRQRIAMAIRDYYRAFEQRSRWLRDDLVVVGELEKYETRLIEEWQLYFEAVKDDIGSSAADEAKLIAARTVLKWAESVPLHIRPSVTTSFVSRGSFHILADQVRVGWHPEFRDRLGQLLGGGSGS